jgi:alkyldihydroxyacetonephosphate synthase
VSGAGRSSVRDYDTPVDALASLIERLPDGAVSTHHGELATHARDRWALAMLREARGTPVSPAAALVFPASTEDVAIVLGWAQETGTPIVPRGRGSGRSGGAQARARSIVVDLSRMNRVLRIDDVSQTIEVQAGAKGSAVETALARRGLTLGHAPVSMDISTVGGWIAAAASGLTQPGYGGIEDVLLGLTAVLPGGDVLLLKPVPRTATGPDLRRLLVGSEGAIAVVTEATLSASRAASLGWEAFRPNSFESGLSLLRELAQRPFRPLVARLFDESRAEDVFASLGHRGPAVLVAFDAGAPGADAERFELRRLARELGPRTLSRELAEHWWDHRFDALERYDDAMGGARTLGTGVVADTVEIAGLWRRLPTLYEDVRGTLRGHAETVGCTVGHLHRSGAALLFPFVIRAADDAEAERRYLQAWGDALRACVRAGGTISYHHGIGLLKAPFLQDEIGTTGVRMLRSIKLAVDPHGVMNPGKLVPEPEGG